MGIVPPAPPPPPLWTDGLQQNRLMVAPISAGVFEFQCVKADRRYENNRSGASWLLRFRVTRGIGKGKPDYCLACFRTALTSYCAGGQPTFDESILWREGSEIESRVWISDMAIIQQADMERALAVLRLAEAPIGDAPPEPPALRPLSGRGERTIELEDEP